MSPCYFYVRPTLMHIDAHYHAHVFLDQVAYNYSLPTGVYIGWWVRISAQIYLVCICLLGVFAFPLLICCGSALHRWERCTRWFVKRRFSGSSCLALDRFFVCSYASLFVCVFECMFVCVFVWMDGWMEGWMRVPCTLTLGWIWMEGWMVACAVHLDSHVLRKQDVNSFQQLANWILSSLKSP